MLDHCISKVAAQGAQSPNTAAVPEHFFYTCSVAGAQSKAARSEFSPEGELKPIKELEGPHHWICGSFKGKTVGDIFSIIILKKFSRRRNAFYQLEQLGAPVIIGKNPKEVHQVPIEVVIDSLLESGVDCHGGAPAEYIHQRVCSCGVQMFGDLSDDAMFPSDVRNH